MANYLIVAGVDGSDGGRRALDWAAREAATRGGAVQAVVAWRWDADEVEPDAPTQGRDRAAALLEQEVRRLAARYGTGFPVAGEVVEGRPAEALTAAARGADLLVLGSHGHSRLRHTVLGSVSEECVRLATCPVVVIPAPVPVTGAEVQPAGRS